uniref:Uncharacterized protein n=1 Tax=Anguilla anguilla TaxID=7936 RepID=A0A0E9PY85_ANGAN
MIALFILCFTHFLPDSEFPITAVLTLTFPSMQQSVVKHSHFSETLYCQHLTLQSKKLHRKTKHMTHLIPRRQVCSGI